MIKDYASDLPMASADVTVAWAMAHRDTARRLVAALDRAVAWFYDAKNGAEAVDILVEVSHADRAQVVESYDFTQEISMYAKDNGVSRTDLQHLIDAMKSIGDLEGASITPEALVIAELTPLTP
jgi:ABC-type nitrate/sulfonate/bicarbonate transport system substrate-binding protein